MGCTELECGRRVSVARLAGDEANLHTLTYIQNVCRLMYVGRWILDDVRGLSCLFRVGFEMSFGLIQRNNLGNYLRDGVE